ncbi:MAG TPA: hypothetical protein VNE61_13150 [Ktedonobacteraceae bacterium]|nr:hypothetical protein [Ktedonobacteraceae bacterium]
MSNEQNEIRPERSSNEPQPMLLASETKLLPENQVHETRRLPENQSFRRRLRPLLRLVLTFFIGFLLGVLVILIFLLSIGGSNALLPVSSTASPAGNVAIHVDSTILVPLVEQGWQQSNIPGSISQVRVQFTEGDLMTISGNYHYSILGIIPISEPFSVQVQPLAEKCYPQLHIVRGSFSTIPITAFVTSFEKSINQQLQQIAKSVPVKFTYCLTGMRTDATGLIATLKVSNLAFSSRETNNRAIWWASV